MSKKIRYIFFVVSILYSTNSRAQDTLVAYTPQFELGSYYQITTVYGSEYRGEVVEETKLGFVLLDKRSNLKHRLYKSDIKEIKPINSKVKNNIGRFDDDYYSNYYMLSENALPYESGAVNATCHYFIENVNYAFTENWSISMNVLLFLPSSVGVKCSYEISKDLYFGANVYLWALPTENNIEVYSVPILGAGARITKGDNNTNFTIGAGALAIKDFDQVNTPTQKLDYTPVYYLNFAYANRFAKHAALNIENFLFPQAFSNPRGSVNLNLTGASIKWIRNENIQWNFGCYGMYLGDLTKLTTNSKIIPIPYISYTQYMN
ncbi:MAG: hypothetical protein KBG47_03375 [Bacteroidia bacterium]|jgi:hypothetical protein|nr:hypothetical protein [Bacteroidia bacterium]